jgi:hypothetical protein
VLLAASSQHAVGLGWVDWVTIIGLPLTLLGLYLTWWQAKKAASAAVAARRAVRRTEQQIRANQLLVLVPQLSRTVAELDSAIQADNPFLAQRDLNSWRWQAGNIHGILSGANPSEKKLLRTLQQSVGLAQTAGGTLLDGKTSVATGCLRARAAIVAACDELTAWVGKNSTEVLSAGNEET